MSEETMDKNRELMLDGNAAGGLLQQIFALEITASPAVCANCGHETAVGGMLAFTQAPGLVLRCPTCESVMLRVVETPDSFYVDARGATFIRLRRTSN